MHQTQMDAPDAFYPCLSKGPIAKSLPNVNPYPNCDPNPGKYKKTVYCRETPECGPVNSIVATTDFRYGGP